VVLDSSFKERCIDALRWLVLLVWFQELSKNSIGYTTTLFDCTIY
jgi:hypothetical protein